MFWRKKRPWKDLAEEFASHVALESDRLQEEGKTTSVAEAAAHRNFGNTTSLLESSYRLDRWFWLDQVGRDFRHALRLLGRRPGFSLVVIFTLALGIGASTAIFSVIDAVLLRPLPYREPERLATLWSADSVHDIREGRVSLLNFADWKSRAHVFEDLTFYTGQTFLLDNIGGPPERMRSARVAANFFPLLGVAPIRGRVFSEEDEKRSELEVVISYGVWQQRFGGSDQAVGATIVMDGRKSQIIGVMPESFRYPFANTAVWEPVTAHRYWSSRDRISPRSFSIWYALGRLRQGIDWREAQSEMDLIGHQLEKENLSSGNPPEIRVVPLRTQTTGPIQRQLAILFGAVLLMLLIACLNIANLGLARGSARIGEFSIRRALGAGQGAIVRQLLTESLVLSTCGGLAGVAFASAFLSALVAYGPADIPRLTETHIDLRTLVFTFFLSVSVAISSGLWPAIRSARIGLRSRQWTSRGQRRIQDVLLMGEYSIALVLLIGAGLMVRSFVQLSQVDPGFRPENLLVMRVDLHVGRTLAQDVIWFEHALDQVRLQPGVKSAGAISDFLRSDPELSVEIEGRPPEEPGPCVDSVTGPFFEAAAIPVLKGRIFTDLDKSDSPSVALINESMARKYWPREDAIGRRFRFPGVKDGAWITVVGIAGDMHRQGLEKQVVPQVFRPLGQSPEDMLDIIVRTSGDPRSLAASVQGAVQSLDKTVAKFQVTTVEHLLGEQTAERRFQTTLMGIFSFLALFLAVMGIYALMHYIVVQRTNEIGLRMALGARLGDVLALIFRHGLMLAIVGIGIGIVVAIFLTSLLANLLYGISPTDPVVFVTVPLVMLGVTALACCIPARRAARIDPMIALRQE